MTEALRIQSVEPVLYGVLKLKWSDGYEAVVDLRGAIQSGDLFAPIRAPDAFARVRVTEHGHSIYWGEPDDEDVDFGCDRLRELAEQQAELLARAS